MLGELTLRDELNARSWSLAEHFKTARWSSRLFGKAEAKAKFCSSPSCFLLQLTTCLPASLHLLCPSHSAHVLGAGSTLIGAVEFYYMAERLHTACLRCQPLWEPFILCLPWQSASHHIPQDSLCSFGDSGPWAVMCPAPCTWGRASLVFSLFA